MNKKILKITSAALLVAAQRAYADMYGIVIGVDNYSEYGSLDGAVNDAKMVANSLKSIGAKQVKLLLDDKATRDGIKKAWDDLSSQASKGDTIFFTFAGHGAQHPERIKGSESDGQDEFYVLSAFTESGKSTYERIVDDDLQEWFSKRPDVNVVLVSDSCHSGTMTRSYQQSKLKYRKAPVKAITNDALPVSKTPEIVNEQKTVLANVVSFSGVPDNEEVPEVTIEDQQHGALSWFFSKGIMGEADTNKDGAISIAELKNYVVEKVRMQTEGQQHPQINFTREIFFNDANVLKNTQPVRLSFFNKKTDVTQIDSIVRNLKRIELISSGNGDLIWDVDTNLIKDDKGIVVYSVSLDTDATKAYKRQAQVKNDPIQETIFSIQKVVDEIFQKKNAPLRNELSSELDLIPFSVISKSDVVEVSKGLSGIKSVQPNQSLLEWNIETGLIKNQFNDVVVNLNSHAGNTKAYARNESSKSDVSLEILAKAQSVINKYRFVEHLKKSSDGTLEVKLLPSDKLHEKGESVRFEINRFKYPYLTLINLAVDGSVNYLYPLLNNDSPSISLDKPYVLDLDVSEPFGSDHLIAIATEKPVSSLHDFLKKQIGSPSSISEFNKKIQTFLMETKYQIAIHSSYTVDRPGFN